MLLLRSGRADRLVIETANSHLLQNGKTNSILKLHESICCAPTPSHTYVDGVCVDSDNGAKDSYGDGCSSYTDSPFWCGNYDDDDFYSMVMCCACINLDIQGDVASKFFEIMMNFPEFGKVLQNSANFKLFVGNLSKSTEISEHYQKFLIGECLKFQTSE